MRRFALIVLFATVATLWVGGTLGIFLLVLAASLIWVYGCDWSGLQ